MRTLPAAEIARILDGSGDWEFRVKVQRATEAGWIDLSDVAGGDWTLALSLGNESPDQPVSTFGARFVMRSDGDALSPGDQTAALNLNSAAAFAPLLYPGNAIHIDAANLASGETRATATWRRWLEGEIEEVEWPGDEVAISCSTPDGRLFAAQVEAEEEHGAEDPGEPVEDEIQGLATRWMDSPPTLYVPVDPDWNVGIYTPESSVGEQALSLAQAQGWDLRYRWDDDAGAYRWTLYLPPRDKTVPDLTIGPDEITEIPGLRVSREYVRNAFTGRYLDATTEDLETRTLAVAGSIAQFGRRWMGITEGDASPITTAAQMDALLDYAAHDLGDVHTEKRVRIPLFPWVELHDLIRVTPDGVRFSGTIDYAVVGVSHEVSAEGGASTVLELRGGSPVGQYFAWHTRPQRPQDPELEFGLIDFREVAPATPGNRRWAWTRRGRQVGEVWWAYKAFPAPWSEDYYAQVAALTVPIPDDQDWIELTPERLPNASQIGALWVEPRLASTGQVYEDADVVERVKIDPVTAFLSVKLTAEIVDNAVDLTLTTTQAAGAKVYPATARIYEDGEGGALIATIPLAADGTVTKATVPALRGRTLPAEGKRTWLAVVTDVAGNVYRDTAEAGAPRLPYFDRIKQALDTSLTAIDFSGRVTDPAGLGGTLEVWVPAGATTPADPEGAPTESVLIAAADMPESFGPSLVAALDAISVAPGTSLVVVLKFTTTDGRTTGQQFFPLQDSMQALVDELGKLRPESVYSQLVMAPELRTWSKVASDPNGLGATPETVGNTQVFTFNASTRVGVRYVWNEGTSAWDVDTSAPVVGSFPIVEAGTVSAEVLTADAAILTLVGAHRVTADNVNIGNLALIADDAGAIVSGSFVNGAGTAGLDLDAVGSEPVLWAPGFEILADGTATYSGALSAATGTFAGNLSAAGGTFTGEVSGDTFSATTANFSGNVWIDGDARFTEGGGLSFYDTDGGLTRHGSVVGAGGILEVTGDGGIRVRTIGGDIRLIPSLGSVNVSGALDVTGDIDCDDIGCDNLTCNDLNGVSVGSLGTATETINGTSYTFLTV